MADRTWQEDRDCVAYDYSSLVNVGKSFLYYVFSVLTGRRGFTGSGVYTLDQCCDSTQVKTDGTNLFGETYDGSKWVGANPNTIHSWFVLHQGDYYLTIDYVGGTGGYGYFATFYWSKVRPSGGTTALRPTASDETDANGNYFSIDNTLSAHRFHAVLSDAGDFWILDGRQTLGYLQTYFAAIHIIPDAANIRTMTWDLLSAAGNNNSGLTTNSYTGAGWKCRRHDNAVVGSWHLVYAQAQGVALDYIAAGGDYFSELAPRMPILVFSQDSGFYGFMGRVPDIEWGPHLMQPRGREAGGPPYAAVLLGPVYLPFTQIPTL